MFYFLFLGIAQTQGQFQHLLHVSFKLGEGANEDVEGCVFEVVADDLGDGGGEADVLATALVGVFVEHVQLLYLLVLLFSQDQLLAAGEDNQNNANQPVDFEDVEFVGPFAEAFDVVVHLNYVMLTSVLTLEEVSVW
jgi:hypothetical protein